MKKTKTSDAYEKIKNLILKGHLESGKIFSIISLVERIGLGRAPVTDAVKRLAAENFLTIIPHQGIMLKDMSITEMRQINETRLLIEPYIIEKVTQTITRDALSEVLFTVQEYIEQMKVCANELNYYGFILFDHKMHMKINNQCENKCVVNILENLRDRMFTVGYKIVVRREGRMQTTITEHQAILAALAKRSPGEAADKMREHLTNGWRLI